MPLNAHPQCHLNPDPELWPCRSVGGAWAALSSRRWQNPQHGWCWNPERTDSQESLSNSTTQNCCNLLLLLLRNLLLLLLCNLLLLSLSNSLLLLLCNLLLPLRDAVIKTWGILNFGGDFNWFWAYFYAFLRFYNRNEVITWVGGWKPPKYAHAATIITATYGVA